MKSENVGKVVVNFIFVLVNFTPLNFMCKDKGLPWSEDKGIKE